MSGPFPDELRQRRTVTSTVDDQRQYDQSAKNASEAESHRGRSTKSNKTGSKPL